MFETVRSKLGPVTGLVDNVAGEGSHLAIFGSDRNFGEAESRRGAVLRPFRITPFPLPAHRTGRADSRIRLSDWLHRKAHGGRPM